MLESFRTTTGSFPLMCEDGLGLRKATLHDIPDLLRLINGYAGKGIMLPRTEFELAENVRDFQVAFAGGRLAGCCALHFYTPQMGEIRSLAVDAEFLGCGAGRKLVQALELEAREYGLAGLFAFTYIPGFFAKLGFREIERGELPLKAWKDCLRCPKFQCCDEVAVIKILSPAPLRVEDTLTCGSEKNACDAGPALVSLPQAPKAR